MKRLELNLNLTSVIVMIAVGVLVPVMLSTVVGIVAIVIAHNAGGIVTGVLVLSFAVTATGSALVTVVLTSRKARLARLQADFVANVSHELRTPLSAIRLYAQTLHAEEVLENPAQAAQCVETILRETEWLDVMIDRVLTWRASSRDMMKLDMEIRPPADAVGAAVTRFRSMVPADEVDIACDIASRRPVLHDRRALNAAILNLLVNAYKYSGPDKRIRVNVRDDGCCVCIDVIDHGVGLSSAEQKRIFQPFYRGRQAAGQSGGVGLGLAIVHYLVKRHGGELTVQSEKGEGATFTVRLPVAPETA